MKYTFTLLEEGRDDAREKIVLESRSSESPRHILLKILAYLLFREHTGGRPLKIEPPDLGQRHRPDLLASEETTGRPLLWIDCGQIEPKRLGRIAATNNGARVVVLKTTGREAELYAQVARKELPVLGVGAAAFVGFLGFEEGFTARAIALLRGANTICRLDTSEDVLSLTFNGENIETSLHSFDAVATPLPPNAFLEATRIVPI